MKITLEIKMEDFRYLLNQKNTVGKVFKLAVMDKRAIRPPEISLADVELS